MQFDFQQQPGLTRWDRDLVTSDEPLISIITPYYNGAQHIRQTCACVLDQTFPWFEWIIVDDGSTRAEDLALLEEIKKEDPRIRIFHKENGGIASARNLGIQKARTELILPLDCDDLMEPTYAEYCWWMLQKNPGAAWAYPDSVGFQNQEYLWHKEFDPELLKKENHLTATALIRKEALLAIGCYDESHKHYNEDWYAWLKMVAKGGYPAQSCGEYLFWYRRNDTGVLSIVTGDEAVKKNNRELISSAAAEVKNPKPPVIYPRPFYCNWAHPRLSPWDKCIYQNKRKIQVAFLFPHLEMGGADKFNLDLLSGLDRNKYDFGILTTTENTQQWLQAFRKVTPDIFNLANFCDPQDYAEFISYYLISRKVDVLFVSNSYHGYYLLPWIRQHFPHIAIVDYVHMEEWYWRGGGYARTSAMAAAVTEKTYVCNSATKNVMCTHFHRDPATVETVYIGVDEKHFDPAIVGPGALYRQIGISESRPIILFICRLHPQKRPFLMLEIAKKVLSQRPDAAFAVVGSGPQEEELQQQAKSMGLGNHVYFLGAHKDVRPFYRDAKLTLVCSLKEGLSLTAYESCAMGVPVVSADVGGQRDLIDDAVGALIPCMQSDETDMDNRSFPEEETNAYTQAILQYLENEELWEAASRTCRSRIEAGFTIGRMIRYFDAELERLATDETLKANRAAVAQALCTCAPLAAEVYSMEMQHESMETYCRSIADKNVLVDFVKRALRWAWRKAQSLLHRILRK